MGYALATPIRPPIPSFYELGDKTMLSVLVRINYMLINAPESGAGTINHSVDMHVFGPQRYKMPKPVQPN